MSSTTSPPSHLDHIIGVWKDKLKKYVTNKGKEWFRKHVADPLRKRHPKIVPTEMEEHLIPTLPPRPHDSSSSNTSVSSTKSSVNRGKHKEPLKRSKPIQIPSSHADSDEFKENQVWMDAWIHEQIPWEQWFPRGPASSSSTDNASDEERVTPPFDRMIPFTLPPYKWQRLNKRLPKKEDRPRVGDDTVRWMSPLESTNAPRTSSWLQNGTEPGGGSASSEEDGGDICPHSPMSL